MSEGKRRSRDLRDSLGIASVPSLKSFKEDAQNARRTIRHKFVTRCLDMFCGGEHPWHVHAQKADEMGDFRLLDRSGFTTYRQRMNIQRVNRESSLFLQDTFHSIVEVRTYRLLSTGLGFYFLTMNVFAAIYWTASDDCELQIKSL
eukprot:gnl/TRDRNA2_/TRDRNA2_162929_c1_seq2.p1 gnl/TRDRNA2_/TRDRNA2_162929_c1~~gnl/TRDRNA2_/TRDRNA2_162929_c1_seq2.p1  ORF type:complete len:146 (-),score=25.27 gnl/TRDRNA2_/TRDRNA2_162929_c1_seq2:9-446(-)